MSAFMKCEKCGHTWHANVVEDDHTTNSFIVEPDSCEECGEPGEVQSVDDDDEMFYDPLLGYT